jgi:hypothetical protein
MKKYNLTMLLSKQPNVIKKNEHFKLLISYYNSSENLKNLMISKKCYSILNKSRVMPEKIDLFYKSCGVPRNSFFPLFLKIKKEYLVKKASFKKADRDYKLNKMKELPGYLQNYLKNFARLEKNINKKKSYPVWYKIIFPKSKKAAALLAGLKKGDWVKMFIKYRDEIKKKYDNCNAELYGEIIDHFILELDMGENSIIEIKKNYRKLSKVYHPDTGGDPEDFMMLQEAYDDLIKSV